MSGIAGIVRLDPSRPIAAPEREALTAALRHRGPDGLQKWSGDGVLLAHGHLGPCDPAQTFADPSDLVVTGDIRLDNRDDLRRRLGLTRREVPTDATLLRAAFAAWGSACCAMLVGDFAFAIWNHRTRSLLLARDGLGVRPLFYRHDPAGIRFASEAGMIADGASPTLNDRQISAFLAAMPEYPDETGFAGVFRLQPGHRLEWRAGRIAITRYFELSAEEHLPSDAAEAFREHFTTAVTDRMVGTRETAAMLSGGLDSSSICAVATRSGMLSGPLRTYSYVYPKTPDLDETSYIDAALAGGDYLPTKLAMDDFAPLAGIEDAMDVQEGPYFAPGLLKADMLYRRAARDGTRIILDGHGGDEVVWHGTGRLMELASQGRWLEAFSLVPTFCRLFGSSRLETAMMLVATYGPQNRATHLVRRAGRKISSVRRGGVLPDAPWQRYLRPEFAEYTDLPERIAALNEMSAEERVSDRAYHARALRSPMQPQAFEILDRASARAGLEARYPFFDTRLVSFCLGLPASEKLRRGETRSVLRRGLRDVLPKMIAERQSKMNFLPELARGLVRHHPETLDAIAADRVGALSPYLDMTRLREAVEALRRDPAGRDGGDVMFIWRVACLHIRLTGRSPSMQENAA